MLLQIGAAITNWGKLYYKLGQLLQSWAIITNWGITTVLNAAIQTRYSFARFIQS